MLDRKVDEVGMPIEQAWFVLEHGSAEGLQVYLEAIKTIKKNCVDVVRCKDCINCIKELNGELYCDILAVGYEPLGSKKVTEDWFCADGERKNT